MKFAGLFAFVSVAYGHTIFQKISVNGVDQGQLKAVRAPTDDGPITDVNDPDLACNRNIVFRDSNIVDIPAGARVGAWWGHVIGGAQYPNDGDNPISPSHKGPVSVYLAKVDNAIATGTNGLQWFKISEDGFDPSTAKWGVDHMIDNGGWQYFDMPTCIAPGQYLMRVELLALHSAYAAGGAQFYAECGQINVTGSGTNTGSSNLVTFPGAYASNDPSIIINIYDSKGVPNNSLKPYAIPGPRALQC
ncbi:glycoside hydrolase [Panaeolus papilionaceus]|nr:glycoside hydrolase [Panaeolus papilionaceus]